MALIESKFVAENAATILKLLENAELSAVDIANRTGINYHSVKKALRMLEDNRLVFTNPGQLRNAKYTIVTDNFNNAIPEFATAKGGKIKAHMLMAEYQNNRPRAAVSIVNLPRHIAKIFKHAERLKSGKTTTLGLQLTRAEVERDYEWIKQAESLYKQLLDSPRMWDEQFLVKFPDDDSYDPELTAAAFAHFFKDDADA